MLRYEILRLADSTNQLLEKITKTTVNQNSDSSDASVSDTQFYTSICEHLGVMTNFLNDILRYVQHEVQEHESQAEKEAKKTMHNADNSQSQNAVPDVVLPVNNDSCFIRKLQNYGSCYPPRI